MPYVNQRGFTRGERKKLEKLLKEKSPTLFDAKFYQELTDEVNGASKKTVKIAVEQVQRWFNKRKGDHVKEADSPPNNLMELVSASDSSTSGSPDAAKVSNNAPKSASDMPKDIGCKKVAEDDYDFEARSSREGAWYDVSEYLSYRTNDSGDPEVRVRFQDFGPEDDEWVNVKEALRERSIPLESSDCHMIAAGDLVLCFRETNDRAAYYDAHVIEIERKQHDVRGCRCIFSVRFVLDQAETDVRLKDLCRRPVYKPGNGLTDNKSNGSTPA